jgi:hypothetical protein
MADKRKRCRRSPADLTAIEAMAAEVRARKAAMTVVPVPAPEPKPPPSPPAIARMNGTFQSGMLALQKMRSGGQQTVRVVHQHVTVTDGAQAVVAGEMNTGPTGGSRKRVGGGSRK